jgi:long-chain acyl-CoA synthetase
MRIAVGLRELGVRKGEIVALQSETRAEFYLADLGVMSTGAVAAALYTSLPYADQARTLHASDARVVFVETLKAKSALENAASASGIGPLNVQWILLADESPGVMTLEHLRVLGEKRRTEDPQAFEKIRAEIDVYDTAILYMTSGATGEPKMGTGHASRAGLERRHGARCTSAHTRRCDHRVPAFGAHCTARRGGVSPVADRRDGLVFRKPGQAAAGAAPRAPDVFPGAAACLGARLFHYLDGDSKAPRRRSPPVPHGAWSRVRGSATSATGQSVPAWIRASLRVLDPIVFAKIRERLGGRLRIAASGAAPLGKDLAEFYAAIGMPLIEGYGLTEGGVAALNPLDRPKAGSIGVLLPDTEARIEDDGELMLRSPCLFIGYYKDPEATAAVLRDGWLATGDIAERDADGYYYITGRKKELIVSSNGKKIYPSRNRDHVQTRAAHKPGAAHRRPPALRHGDLHRQWNGRRDTRGCGKCK